MWSLTDWWIALGGGLVIALIWARRHMSTVFKPVVRNEPTPVFVDGDPQGEDDGDENSP